MFIADGIMLWGAVCVCVDVFVGLDSCTAAHTDFFLGGYGLWHTPVWRRVLDGTRNVQGCEVILKWYRAWQQRTQTPPVTAAAQKHIKVHGVK